MNAISDISINRLKIKASSPEARNIVRDLEYSSWSYTPSEEWIFVNKLDVMGGAGDLRQKTSVALESACRQAVDGSLHTSGQPNAVRFKNLPELLAFLIRDLVAGDAAAKWYWKRWSYLFHDTKNNALARVLWENLQYIPAVVENLVQLGKLKEVWDALDSQTGEVLYQSLRSCFSQASSTVVVNTIDVHKTENENILRSLSDIVIKRPILLGSWINILKSLEQEDGRTKLAISIIALRHFPTLYIKNPEQCNQMVYQIAQTGVNSLPNKKHLSYIESSSPAIAANRDSMSVRRDESPKIIDIQTASGEKPHQREINSKNNTMRLNSDVNDEFIQNANSSTGAEIEIEKPRSSNQMHVKREKMEDRKQRLVIPTDKEENNLTHVEGTLVSGFEFHTKFGGVFYLINALNRVQDTLHSFTSSHDLNAGWRWLYEITRRFPIELDPSLSRFFAQQIGYESATDLQKLPRLKELETLFVHFQTLYGACWTEQMLDVPATVVYSPSHIDCFLPMSCVNLNVRKMGLDINPGWVSWLSRVIQFHFRSDVRSAVLQETAISESSLTAKKGGSQLSKGEGDNDA